MLFNSVEFLIFFPLVTALYFATPFRFRWLFLLGASYYFYMNWKAEYIVLLLASTTISFFAARAIAGTQVEARRRNFLILGLCADLAILFFFKYFNFFSTSLAAFLSFFGLHYTPLTLDILWPVGISFYTFLLMGYLIDVYRGRQQPENHFGTFALFASFFPHVLAGPIERSAHLLPQFYERHKVEYQRIVDGLKLMAWGFFKKVVIADRLAVIVNAIYDQPTAYTGMPLMIATFFFAIQIYCDFSGYSDIAIGAAKVLGFNLIENFRQPYFAKSIGEFWRRWHISLSTWFRDYLYIPLGGNRVTKWRWYFNIMVVFLVSGLWHGASWTFVIWGGLHGLYMLAFIWTTGFREKLLDLTKLRRYSVLLELIQMAGVFLLVCFAWIFFRANTFSDAIYIVRHLFVGINLTGNYGMNVGGSYELAIIALSILALLLVDFFQARGTGPVLANKPIWVRWAVYYALIFSILLFGKFGTTEFIYVQF